MTNEFRKISYKDLGRGIDTRSAPSAIEEGYSEVLENCDVSSNGFISKRKGHEGYYGYLPMRVQSIAHANGKITLGLGSSVDVQSIASTPIVIQGRLPAARGGDWTNVDNVEYYTGFTTDIPDTLMGSYTVGGGRHGVDSSDMFTSCLFATSFVTADNEFVYLDEISIDESSPYDVDFIHSDFFIDPRAYLLVVDKSTVGGESFVDTTTISGGDTTTISIPAATHQLDNFNIIAQHYGLYGSRWTQIEPEQFSFDIVTGEVSVTYTNSSAGDIDYKTVLSAPPIDQTGAVSINAGNSGSIVINTNEDFYFISVYANSGGTLTKVIPDSIIRNDDANTTTVTIFNGATTVQSYELYWEAAPMTSSSIVVEDNSGTTTLYAYDNPQMTVWGIPHTGAYTTDVAQEGHVTHIDSYRREAEERIVAGLGGNIYTTRTREEAGVDYLIPSNEVNLESRMNADTALAPAFATTGSDTTRTRGLITADEVSGTGQALITAVELVSPGVTKYTLQLTNKSGNLGTAIDSSGLLADYFTVTGMANAVHNGRFRISDIDNDNDTITVSNPAAKLSELDETGALGRGGVYSEQLVMQASTKFMLGDTLTSSVFGSLSPNVVAVDGANIGVDGITSGVNLSAGQRIFGRRIASVLPMVSVDNIVRGDMCSLTGLNRPVRVVFVNNRGDLNIDSITGNGTKATLSTATPHGFTVNQRIIIMGTGIIGFDGVHVVTGLPTLTSLEFASTTTDTVAAGFILGNNVEIDEEVLVQDAGANPSVLSVIGRWIPAEAPTSADSLPASTYTGHLVAKDATQQDIVRSVMVADNLYLTNYADEVLKFDGTNLYQTGLFRWQPQLFANVNTGVASIPRSLIRTSYNLEGGVDEDFNAFTVESVTAFSVGDIVVDDDTNITYTITAIDTTTKQLFMLEDVSASSVSGEGAVNTLRKTTRYRYYFRLNAIDANQNVVASAATGADDFIIDMPASGQIHIRLVGFPVWGNYDFDNIELQVYRTVANTSGPYYLVRNLDVNFNVGGGYLDIFDGTIDSLLLDFDEINSGLKGAELGTTWTQPLRAKYCTTTENRLVLANVKDYPELDIVLRKKAGAIDVTAANLAGKKFLFRKDSLDTGTTTDMVNRATYEFVTSGAVTITPLSDITRIATHVTVEKTAHGLNVGDWVYLFHSAAGINKSLAFAGWWRISAKTDNTFTFKHNNTATPSAADVDRYVGATAKTDIPVWLGTDGNYNQLGANTINEFTAVSRLANAINASQRVASDPLMSGFSPWMIANAGSEYGVGRLIIRQERVFSSTCGVTLPAAIDTADVFVQGTRRAASATIAASTKLFPSRLIISYPNFPEMFDNPFGEQRFSDSAIDVNAADGQEITGVIPFFGDSVFGDSRAESVLVVFKENSIYLLDIGSKQLSKIESRGLGCTAPYSIASTRDGIVFANQSGIYRLNKDQSISYVGQMLERLWQDSVNSSQLSRATGHHYGRDSQYKLSVPVDSRTNDQVYVYDHQREGRDQEFGAWTSYTNHSATGWANLDNNAFFATTDGQVYKIRNAGDASDYRDDTAGIHMTAIMRADDFGVGNARKIAGNVTTDFQLRRSGITGTTLYISTDLDGEFVDAGTFTIEKDGTIKVATVVSSLPRRRAVYYQLKYENDIKDEDVVIAGVSWNVALLDNSHGIKQQNKK